MKFERQHYRKSSVKIWTVPAICNVLHSICQVTSCKFKKYHLLLYWKIHLHCQIQWSNQFNMVFRNPRVPCHTMPQIDLNAWRENVVQGCQIGGRQVAVGQSAFPSPCTSCICTNEGVRFFPLFEYSF